MKWKSLHFLSGHAWQLRQNSSGALWNENLLFTLFFIASTAAKQQTENYATHTEKKDHHHPHRLWRHNQDQTNTRKKRVKMNGEIIAIPRTSFDHFEMLFQWKWKENNKRRSFLIGLRKLAADGFGLLLLSRLKINNNEDDIVQRSATSSTLSSSSFFMNETYSPQRVKRGRKGNWNSFKKSAKNKWNIQPSHMWICVWSHEEFNFQFLMSSALHYQLYRSPSCCCCSFAIC